VAGSAVGDYSAQLRPAPGWQCRRSASGPIVGLDSRDPTMGGRARMRIGVLTGGGDCPGLNAVIRAVVRKGVATYGHEFVGFRDGWRGPLEGLTRPLGIAEVRG